MLFTLRFEPGLGAPQSEHFHSQLVCYKRYTGHSLYSSCSSEAIFFPPRPQPAKKGRTVNYPTKRRRRRSEASRSRTRTIFL